MKILSIHKTCDFTPSRPCVDTLYGPSYLRIDDAEILYMQGGHIDQPVGAPPLGHPDRFADKIYVSTRSTDEVTWSENPKQIVGAPLFPWMLSPPEVTSAAARVGSASGAHVVKLGNFYHMFFSASISDPNCCTGEHPNLSNQYGSCAAPWSYFVVYHAWSVDGLKWFLHNPANSNQNEALQNSILFYEPTAAEKSGDFKGITSVRSAVYDNGYVYLWCEFWRTTGLRQFLVRTNLLTTDIYNGTVWEKVENRILPNWVNAPNRPDGWQDGNQYAHNVTHVTKTSLFPGYKYILLAPKNGVNNGVEYSLSNDLLTWTPQVALTSFKPGVCDGTGTPGTVLDPHYFEFDGKPYCLFGSGDWNLDGAPDCSQGPYYGLAIMEAYLELDDKDVPPVVVPPIIPPVVPPISTLPFEYNVEQHTGLDTTLLTTKKGYALGDGIYVTSTGLWCIRHVGQPPLFPASDGDQWLLHGTVTV